MFSDFFEDDDKEIVLAAKKLESLRALLTEGELGQADFQELAEDILDMQRIEDRMLGVTRSAQIEKAFDLMLVAVKAIIKVV